MLALLENNALANTGLVPWRPVRLYLRARSAANQPSAMAGKGVAVMTTHKLSASTLAAFALILALVCTAPLSAACSTEPDAPDCSCFDDTGAWAPTGAYIQDIALDTLGTEESCPCPGTFGCNWEIAADEAFTNAGKPYYQMVLGANSETTALIMAWALSYCGPIFHHREAWCSETISYWHREAGIPYSDGYKTCGWHCDWQNYNVGQLKTWYETEDYINPFGFGGRGRWISYEEIDYENFELGVTVPVPGAYVAIRGYDAGPPGSWHGLSNSHSLMIDEMWVHKGALGRVFQIEVTLLEGNSGNRVRNDHSYDDLWSRTPAGPDWIGSDRKIYGFGIDLDDDRKPVYDESRLHYVHHPHEYIAPVPDATIFLDKDWATRARLIPELRVYAELIRKENGPKVVCSAPQVKLPGIPDGNDIKWYFPREQERPIDVLIDLMAVHPLPIKGLEMTWGGQFVPKDYGVQFAEKEQKYLDATVPDLSQIKFPQQIQFFTIPAYFSDSPSGVSVRYVRLRFPKGTFMQNAVLEELRFKYDQGPWEDAEDNPPCRKEIPGDINEDCIVDFEDFAIMAAHWLEESQ